MPAVSPEAIQKQKEYYKWYSKTPKAKANQRARARRYKARHPGRIESLNHKIWKRNRDYCWDYKSTHPCVDCGESDPVVLEFDHRDRKDKSFAIAVKRSHVSLETLMAEIAKCDTRCANCHRKRHFKEKKVPVWA